MEREALVIRHSVTSHAGLVGRALEAQQWRLRQEQMGEGLTTPELGAAELVVVLGSGRSVNDATARAGWFGDELELLGRARAQGVAIFGVCFGAQALCVLGGGTVEPARIPEVGWREVAGGRIVQGWWFEFHTETCTLAEGMELLAQNEAGVQAFGWGRDTAVQFHPEIDAQQLAGWYAGDPGRAERSQGQSAAQIVAESGRRADPARVAALVGLVLARAGLSESNGQVGA